MLSLMREKAGSWIIKIILGVIVIVFVFWGVGSFQEERGKRVAVVNGEAISVDDYKRTYQNYMANLERQYGQSLNSDMLKILQVPRQVMESLISQKLMVQEARKMELKVTDQEVVDSIQGMGAFQQAGVFDNRLYQMTLNRNQLAPEVFEAAKRESLLLQKFHTILTNNVKVPEGEIKEWYNWQKASVNLEVVVFSPDSYKDITPTEDELTTYYEENKGSYKTEPMVKTRYLEFDTNRFKEPAKISEEDIANYYEDHLDQFKKEKTVSARHVLIKVDQNSSEEVVDEKRKKAEEVMTLAKEGKDFAELAKKYSEGPTKDKGGDLGDFTKETMVKPFADKAFSMAPGDISEPVRTQFGWHIIKVEKVNEATTESLEAVSDKIRDDLAAEEAVEDAFDTAETVFDALADDDDFEKVAESFEIPLRTTDFFTRKGPEVGIGEAAKFAELAFDLEDMEISDIRKFGDRYFIIQKLESKPAVIFELADVKEKVTQDCIQKMQDEKAKTEAEAFLEVAKEKKELQPAVGDSGREIVETGFFTREVAIPKVGQEFEISRAAFSLTDSAPIAENVLKGRSGYYVIKLKERKPADQDGFAAQKDSIEKRLLSQKQNSLIQNWLDGVKAKSEIQIEEGYL